MADKWDQFAEPTAPQTSGDKWEGFASPAPGPEKPGFLSSAWDTIKHGPANLLAAGNSINDLVAHPSKILPTVEGMGQRTIDLGKGAVKSFGEGNPVAGVRKGLNAVINSVMPGLGEQSEDAGEAFDKGNTAEGFGKTAGVGLNTAAALMLPRASKATSDWLGDVEGVRSPVKIGEPKLPPASDVFGKASGHMGLPSSSAYGAARSASRLRFQNPITMESAPRNVPAWMGMEQPSRAPLPDVEPLTASWRRGLPSGRMVGTGQPALSPMERGAIRVSLPDQFGAEPTPHQVYPDVEPIKPAIPVRRSLAEPRMQPPPESAALPERPSNIVTPSGAPAYRAQSGGGVLQHRVDTPALQARGLAEDLQTGRSPLQVDYTVPKDINRLSDYQLARAYRSKYNSDAPHGMIDRIRAEAVRARR